MGQTLQQRYGATVIVPVGSDQEQAVSIVDAIGTFARVWPRGKLRDLAAVIAVDVEVAAIGRATAQKILREDCRWHDDTVAIVFFGFLHPVKGLETLLLAFKKVLQTQPQARLLLVGGVESLALRGEDAKRYGDQLHSLVQEFGLAHLVHLTGYVSAETASHYLIGADIEVLPFNHGVSLKSGSLLTLLAHGLPVVATQHTASLPDGHPVRLLPPRDIDALVARLLELLNNPAVCIQVGADGRAFMQNFNWQSIARAHSCIYKELFNLPYE